MIDWRDFRSKTFGSPHEKQRTPESRMMDKVSRERAERDNARFQLSLLPTLTFCQLDEQVKTDMLGALNHGFIIALHERQLNGLVCMEVLPLLHLWFRRKYGNGKQVNLTSAMHYAQADYDKSLASGVLA